MCSSCCNMSIWNWTFMIACSNKSCDMCHVNHKICAYFISNFSKSLKINFSCICTCTCNNKFRFAFFCNTLNFIIIYISVAVYSVWDTIKVFTRKVYRTSMCKVSAMVEIHSHKCISRLHKCKKYCHICLST